jgi:hypothetical protein
VNSVLPLSFAENKYSGVFFFFGGSKKEYQLSSYHPNTILEGFVWKLLMCQFHQR